MDRFFCSAEASISGICGGTSEIIDAKGLLDTVIGRWVGLCGIGDELLFNLNTVQDGLRPTGCNVAGTASGGNTVTAVPGLLVSKLTAVTDLVQYLGVYCIGRILLQCRVVLSVKQCHC